MKTKIFKKITAAMLAATMAVTSVSASAENLSENTDDITLTSFVNDAVFTALKMNDMENGIYNISDLIPFYDFETGEICSYKVLILNDNEIAAEMDIWINDGVYYSSFEETPDNPAQSFLGENICYGNYDNALWLCVNNRDFYQLDSESASEPSIQKSCAASPVSISDSISYTPAVSARAVTDSIILDVEHKSNAKVKNDNGEYTYICWAACIAMKVKYLKKGDYEAYEIYKHLKDSEMLYDGSISCVIDAYDEFGVSVSAAGQAKNKVLWNTLNNNQPFDIAIRGIRSDGVIENHQVLVCGMAKAATGIAYKFDCPNNKDNKRVVQIAGDIDDLLDSYLTALPYTDFWSYRGADFNNDGESETINFNNVYRTYYTTGSLK